MAGIGIFLVGVAASFFLARAARGRGERSAKPGRSRADDATAAAISSEMAARLYGVPVLRARIEDNPANSTRFLIIGREPTPPTGRDKTSILFSMKNEPMRLPTPLEPECSMIQTAPVLSRHTSTK